MVEEDTQYLEFTYVRMNHIVGIDEIRDETPQMKILYDHEDHEG